MSRAEVLQEVVAWAASKRDQPGRAPMGLRHTEARLWREGYTWAMNDVAQHFNMERFAAEEAERKSGE